MKRWLSIWAAAVLVGCGGGNVAVEVERDAATDGTSLSELEAAQSVRLPIAEVRLHLANEGTSDDQGGWHTLPLETREVDLLALPIDGSVFLGDLSLPAGKITQIRLRLAATGGEGVERVISGAVTEAAGSTCDLIVPASAWEQGVKIVHPFKLIDVDPAQRVALVLAFSLQDASRSSEAGGCAWRLRPVLKLKKPAVELEPQP
jgi:hypothetical protein